MVLVQESTGEEMANRSWFRMKLAENGGLRIEDLPICRSTVDAVLPLRGDFGG